MYFKFPSTKMGKPKFLIEFHTNKKWPLDSI